MFVSPGRSITCTGGICITPPATSSLDFVGPCDSTFVGTTFVCSWDELPGQDSFADVMTDKWERLIIMHSLPIFLLSPPVSIGQRGPGFLQWKVQLL